LNVIVILVKPLRGERDRRRGERDLDLLFRFFRSSPRAPAPAGDPFGDLTFAAPSLDLDLGFGDRDLPFGERDLPFPGDRPRAPPGLGERGPALGLGLPPLALSNNDFGSRFVSRSRSLPRRGCGDADELEEDELELDEEDEEPELELEEELDEEVLDELEARRFLSSLFTAGFVLIKMKTKLIELVNE